MNFAKEAQFALQLLQSNAYLLKAAKENEAALEYAIINLASIGITLNPALKEAYLVPRGGKICLDISYIGLVKLATDTGAIDWVQAEIVKKNDKFKSIGVGHAPIHEVDHFSDRGEVVGVYCVAKLSTGECLSTIMSKAECDAIRDKSSQASKSGPWVSFYEEMLKKTCIKRASKLWPKSERVQKAADILNEHEGIDFVNGSYYEADIAKLDWHCGITFYEETSLLNHAGRTIVKAGCDFQHLYDDHYMTEDYGQRIIDRCVPGLKNQFISLISGAEVTA
jgi:phage RecT family recombinase